MINCSCTITHEMFAQMTKEEGESLRENMRQYISSLGVTFSYSFSWDENGYKFSYPRIASDEEFAQFRKFDSWLMNYLKALGFDEDGKKT